MKKTYKILIDDKNMQIILADGHIMDGNYLYLKIIHGRVWQTVGCFNMNTIKGFMIDYVE